MATKRTVQYFVSSTSTLTLEVTEAVAKALESTGRANRRSDARWESTCKPLSDVALAGELANRTAKHRPVPEDARYWEGPKLAVRLFIGDALAWPVEDLPDGRCGSCRGEHLPGYAACLWCGATGIDHELPPVRPSERPKLVVADGLGGGLGPAQPKARVPKAKKASRTRARCKS